jgi:hypothetical protein
MLFYARKTAAADPPRRSPSACSSSADGSCHHHSAKTTEGSGAAQTWSGAARTVPTAVGGATERDRVAPPATTGWNGGWRREGNGNAAALTATDGCGAAQAQATAEQSQRGAVGAARPRCAKRVA